jgi:hypothetical protein
MDSPFPILLTMSMAEENLRRMLPLCLRILAPWVSQNPENTCRAPLPAQNPQPMDAPKKEAPGVREPAEQGAPATLGQKIFIVLLCLYVLSLVWLTLSHHWYGVLPKWLDPH